MNTFRGLIYVKHASVGTRSEGPSYFLQTKEKDFRLQYTHRNPWEPDFKLEFYNRHMVEIVGDSAEDLIVINRIHEIAGTQIPDSDDDIVRP